MSHEGVSAADGSVAAFDRDALWREVDAGGAESLEWLKRLAAMPSVSATGEGIRSCAEAVADLLRSLGVEAELLETGHHPLVWGTIGEGSPHLMVYGHYDVVSVSESDGWRFPPFEPTIADGAIWGRGVGDNKGQMLAHMRALRAWIDTFGDVPPFRITFVIDGEDEIGGPYTRRYIAEHPERFRADYLLCADASTLGIDGPALFLGCRGALYFELHAKGSPTEWHSSSYGGVLPNPVQRLAEAITTLIDEQGRVRDPEFDRDRVEPTEAERAVAARLPEGFIGEPSDYGVDRFVVDDPLETMFFGSRVCVCGFGGGHTGEGPKLALPNHAFAKFDVALQPNQQPASAAEHIRAYLDAKGFDDIEMKIVSQAPGSAIPYEHELVQTTIEALTNVWGKEPVAIPSIGAGGIFAAFVDHAGTPCLIVPYGQADLNEHSADEHLSLEWFHNGIRTSAEIYRLLATRAAGAASR